MDYWYEIHGEGIPVVLLHGFTGSSTTWRNLIESSPAELQYITIDLPGHGRTKGDTIKTMAACCDDLSQLFLKLQLDKFYLVGYSLGGRTALTYALKYPETIQGLLLESASPGLSEASERQKRKENDGLLADRILSKGLEAFVNEWENIPLFDTQKSLSIEKQKEIREERLRQNAKGLAHSLQGMGTGMQASHWENLAGFHCPVYLIVGRLDKKFAQINKRMLDLLPNATLEIFESAGHAVHIEQSEAFKQHVIAFANSHTT